MVDDSSVQNLIERMSTFFDSLPPALANQISTHNWVGSLKDVQRHIRQRSLVCGVLECYSQLSEPQPSPSVALDEWVSKRTAGEEANSFLSIGLAMHDGIKYLWFAEASAGPKQCLAIS